MYDRYSFILHWSDLTPEVQEMKIDEYLEREWAQEDEETRPTLAEYQNDQDIRARAERIIEAHFPIYF